LIPVDLLPVKLCAREEITSSLGGILITVSSRAEDAEYYTNVVFEVVHPFQQWFPGDIVFFNYLEVRNAQDAYGHGLRRFIINGETLYFMHPKFINMTITKDGIMMAGIGKVIVHKVEDQVGVWKVIANGELHKEQLHMDPYMPSIGKYVLTMGHSGVPLEAPGKVTMKPPVYWIRQNEILAESEEI